MLTKSETIWLTYSVRYSEIPSTLPLCFECESFACTFPAGFAHIFVWLILNPSTGHVHLVTNAPLAKTYNAHFSTSV